jgi:hypothetical protein
MQRYYTQRYLDTVHTIIHTTRQYTFHLDTTAHDEFSLINDLTLDISLGTATPTEKWGNSLYVHRRDSSNRISSFSEIHANLFRLSFRLAPCLLVGTESIEDYSELLGQLLTR